MVLIFVLSAEMAINDCINHNLSMKKKKIRNEFVIAMRKRCKGGKHQSKKNRRKSNKNKEIDDELHSYQTL